MDGYLGDIRKKVKRLPLRIADFTEDNILEFTDWLFQLMREGTKKWETPLKARPLDVRHDLVEIRELEQLLEQAIPNYRVFLKQQDVWGNFALDKKHQLSFVPQKYH